jgi:hypothetical protein
MVLERKGQPALSITSGRCRALPARLVVQSFGAGFLRTLVDVTGRPGQSQYEAAVYAILEALTPNNLLLSWLHLRLLMDEQVCHSA